MPWSFIADQLHGLGAKQLPPDPMLNYWLRMTAGAFTGIGLFFFLLALKPTKFACIIPFAGGFLLLEGLILLISNRLLHLSPLPSLFDAAFCFLIGTGILLARSAAIKKG